ncbi:MAG TPA: hypothetical protein VF743_01695 [Acidimicrobiales bacterium]
MPGDPLQVALVSATPFRELDDDLPLLVDALEAAGAAPRVVCWDEPGSDDGLAGVDAAVLRSTWDYIDRVGEFLAWVDRAGRATRLANDPALVRWNASKRYLADLAAAGLPVVASWWPADHPAGAGDGVDPAALPPWDDLVVKPSVSAGSRRTGRYRGDPAGAAAFAGRLRAAGVDVLVQPYVASVDADGEIGLLVFGGRVSHAVRKHAVLEAGRPPVDGYELAVAQRVEPVAPPPGSDALVADVLAALPGREAPLYARVDVVAGDDGPLLLEVELIEPALFVDRAPGAADRYAAAVVAWAAGGDDG